MMAGDGSAVSVVAEIVVILERLELFRLKLPKKRVPLIFDICVAKLFRRFNREPSAWPQNLEETSWNQKRLTICRR
jgi:hypothetical protein